MTKYREIMRLSVMGQPTADVAAAGCNPSTVRRALKAASETWNLEIYRDVELR